jgi:hypothetical protein
VRGQKRLPRASHICLVFGAHDYLFQEIHTSRMLCNKVQDSGALESTLFYLPQAWNGEP